MLNKSEKKDDIKDRIRVLHYIGALELGGSQSFVMELYRHINREKIQFDFVIFPNERGPLYDEILSLGGKIYECLKFNGLNSIKFVKWWDEFLKKHDEYNVIHGHVRSVASIYLPVIKKNKRFSILHCHSSSNGKGIKAVIKYIMQLPIKYQADYYMACSDEAGRWLFGKNVVESRRYRTVPNAIDAKRFLYDENKRVACRRKLGIENSFVIGHVGRFSEVKNHSFLLELLRRMISTRRDLCLLLVGDGPMMESIKQKAIDMNIENNVIFVGANTNTEDYYNAMDCFVFPSLWEGFGMVLVEAQTSGLKCVSSNYVPRVVDIGANLVSFLDIDKNDEKTYILWKNAINEAEGLSRKSYYEEIRNKGYDIKDNVEKMEKFYIKVATYIEG